MFFCFGENLKLNRRNVSSPCFCNIFKLLLNLNSTKACADHNRPKSGILFLIKKLAHFNFELRDGVSFLFNHQKLECNHLLNMIAVWFYSLYFLGYKALY